MASESGRNCLVPPAEKAKKNSNGMKVCKSKFKKEWMREFPVSKAKVNSANFIAYLAKRMYLVAIKVLAMSKGI